ncbi:hypothetical protein PG985_003362 [Apiospora marii]|uniref:Uncharacterized protein n=1 Tax=Apiospora marii TaxID=335849 RepID=A0ABR1RVE2_9PEZI
MHHPKNTEDLLGDHCVCHYPDDSTQTWLIDDDDEPQVHGNHDAIFSFDDDEAADLYNATTTNSVDSSIETAHDAIDIPLHYTAQGEAIQALYCACFVVNESLGEEDLSSPSSIKGGAADPLFAGAVVLNHTSGDYDYIHLQSEFGGLTKASVMLTPQPQPQAHGQAEGETSSPFSLHPAPPSDGTTTKGGNGILRTALERQSGLGRYSGVMVFILAFLSLLAVLRWVRKTRDVPDWRLGRGVSRSRYV